MLGGFTVDFTCGLGVFDFVLGVCFLAVVFDCLVVVLLVGFAVFLVVLRVEFCCLVVWLLA